MAKPGIIEGTLATMLRKASHSISIIISTWNCSGANINTVTIDHLQQIHLQRYYVDLALLNRPSPPCLVSRLLQNNLRKPHFGVFFVGQHTSCIFIKYIYVYIWLWWVREGRGEVVGLSSVCCLYTKQRVLEACARSILLAKRSDSSVPSQHI